jgi:hypothetical protein
MLDVIKHKQQFLVTKHLAQNVGRHMTTAVLTPQRPQHSRTDQRWIVQSGELDQCRTVGEVASELGGERERETGLADAARSGQRNQADGWIAEMGYEPCEIRLPANERGQRDWQFGGSDTPSRRERHERLLENPANHRIA